MPGPSWSISATKCQVGSTLRKIPGTPCSTCYALKGRYSFETVKSALHNRYYGWKNDKDWVILMSIRLLYLADKYQYFRFFDSGDVQSTQMMEDINQIAWNIEPYVNVWLPTQQRNYVSALSKQIAPNLTIRISSTKINEKQTTTIVGVVNSAVYNVKNNEPIKDAHICPSRYQQNQCGQCRACWDLNQEYVIYHQH